jgi:hypothetical protein
VLALDTAGSASSVAVWRDGAILTRTGAAGGHHSEHLLALVEAIMAESGLRLAELDAVACGRGPGAFTGVRLAVGVAQGWPMPPGCRSSRCRTWGRRRAPSILRARAVPPARVPGRAHARVYWAAYERAWRPALRGCQRRRSAGRSRSRCLLPGTMAASCGVGNGFDAYPLLAERLRPRPGAGCRWNPAPRTSRRSPHALDSDRR